MQTRRLFLGAAAGAMRHVRAEAVEVRDIHGQKVTVTCGGVTLFEYSYSRARPKTYVHPLCVADGTPVTLDGPEDHVHHRGLMAAWSEVNGIDFWGEVNPARHGSIVHQRFERLKGGAAAEIVAVNHWIAEGGLLLVERRTIRAPAPDSDGVWLDWTTELRAPNEPVTLAAGQHVYNGLGIRFTKPMDGGEVLNSNGTPTIGKANGEPARWCAYAGAGMGLAFFDHPGNPRHPNAFFVMNNAFGYMSAAPTFRQPFNLPVKGSIRFRWGVLTFRGTPDARALDRRFESWRKS